MGTSKHIAILLTVALTGILTAGQDQPTASSQTAPRGPSNTRSASCIVRITVDPALLPLNPETVSSLIHSPAVLGKALRDVLSVNTLEDFLQPEPQGGVGREPIMIRWLNASSAPASSGARSLQRPDTSGAGGGVVGAMGGMGMGSGASWVQEHSTELQRVPGETDAAYRNRVAQVRAAHAAAPQEQPGGGIQRSPGESDVAYRTRVAQVRSQQKALQEMKSRGMGGMGMGGMGGGYGGMGGMMGEYGGMGGMGFSYGAPSAPRPDVGAAQSATIELQVNLPDTVPALADEFLKSVVRNLQDSLLRAHEEYRRNLQEWLNNARTQRRTAEAVLDGTPDDPAVLQDVQRRLNTTVDLSALNSQMPLSDAVDLLKKSVDPPLNIVVLWSNLADYVRVEPTTPVNIDGMVSVRLGTALDLLVKGIPNRLGSGGPTWKIKDNVIVIGTVVALAETRDSGAKPRVETDAVNLAGQRSELTRRVQALELDLAGIDARREAIAAQTAGVRQRVSEKLSVDPVIRELEQLSQIYPSTSTEEKEKTIRAKIELANRREELSKQVGGGQLEEFNKELSRMAIDKAEKAAQLQIVRKQLDEVQKQLAQMLAFDPEAARLRWAQESLDFTGRRVTELETRLADLQPPTALVIGAN